MSDAWRRCTIGDLATVFDGPHATPAKTESGPWYLSISSLVDGRLDLSNSAHLSTSDFTKWTKRVTPQSGDTLFSYETRLGDAAHWDLQEPAALGRRMGLLRPKRDVVDPRFLTYAWLGPEFQQEIQKRAIRGATVDRIPIAELASWPIRVPSLDEQRRIAGVLGALDDLIEVNRRLMADLDELGLALFRNAWDRQTWCSVSDLGTVTMGQSPPGSTYNEEGRGLVFYQGVRDFGARYPTPRVHCTAATRKADSGDILIAVRAPIGDTNVAVEPTAIGRGLAALKANQPALALRALRATSQTWSAHEGTGTVFSSISGPDLRAAKVPAVTDAVLEAHLSTLDHAHLGLAREVAELEATRGELLPLLMSGRVRVGDVAA